MSRVRIYTTQYCPFCVRAKQLFEKKNVPFEEIDLTFDDETRDRLVEETGWMTVPMVFVGEKFIGGFDETYALERKGELDSLLEAEGSS